MNEAKPEDVNMWSARFRIDRTSIDDNVQKLPRHWSRSKAWLNEVVSMWYRFSFNSVHHNSWTIPTPNAINTSPLFCPTINLNLHQQCFPLHSIFPTLNGYNPSPPKGFGRTNPCTRSLLDTLKPLPPRNQCTGWFAPTLQKPPKPCAQSSFSLSLFHGSCPAAPWDWWGPRQSGHIERGHRILGIELITSKSLKSCQGIHRLPKNVWTFGHPGNKHILKVTQSYGMGSKNLE